MGNLDNLLTKVMNDADKEVQSILNEAKEKSRKLLEEREEEAEQKRRQLLEKAEREAISIKERNLSNARLQVRNLLLEAKRDVLERVFQEALHRLESLDEAAYLSFIEHRIKSLLKEGSEVLIVPKKYLSAVKTMKLPVKISEQDFCESGFILKSDKYIIDHTFKALIDYKRDQLELEVANMLFSDEGLVE